MPGAPADDIGYYNTRPTGVRSMQNGSSAMHHALSCQDMTIPRQLAILRHVTRKLGMKAMISQAAGHRHHLRCIGRCTNDLAVEVVELIRAI